MSSEYSSRACNNNFVPGMCEFEGPGMQRHANRVQLNTERMTHNAETVVRLLNEAFEAGKAAARAEIRRSLGVLDNAFGVSVR